MAWCQRRRRRHQQFFQPLLRNYCTEYFKIIYTASLYNVNYWRNTSPFTFPLCSQYQELIVSFFFHIDIELSYGDNYLVFLLASLRPVSSRPWPIFSSSHLWCHIWQIQCYKSHGLDLMLDQYIYKFLAA